MASGKEYKISFKLNADLESSFNSVMQKAERDFKALERQIMDISGMRINGNVLTGLQTATQGLERDMRQISRIPGPSGYFTDMKNDLRAMLPELKDVQRTLEAISRVRMPSNMFRSDMERYVRETRELEENLRRIQNAGGPSGGGGGGGSGDPGGGGGGGGLIALGGPALMAGAAVAAAGVGIFSVADDYQKAMNQIQSATDVTADQMQAMRDSAKAVYGANVGEGWEDIGQVMSKVSQVMGSTGPELEQTTINAIALRDTFENMDVDASIKAAHTLSKQFGITAGEAQNLFAQAGKQGLDYSGELLDSANEYAVYFKTLGLSAEDMFNVFKSGKESGAFNLDKVGDSVKEFGIRIKDGSKTTQDAIGALFATPNNDAFIAALTKGGQKSVEFGQLVKQVGDKDIANDLVKSLQKGGGAAEKAFTTITNEFSGGQAMLDSIADGSLKGTEAMSSIIKELMAMDDASLQAQYGVALFGTQWEDMEATTISALTNIGDTFDQTKDTMGEITKIKYSSIGDAFRGIGRQLQTTFILPLVDAALPALSAFSNWFATAIPKVKAFFSSFGGGIFGKIGGEVKELGLNIGWLMENGFDGEMEGVTSNYLKAFGMSENAAERSAAQIGDIFKEIKFFGFSEVVDEQIADVIERFGIDRSKAEQIASTFHNVFDNVKKGIEGFRNFITPVMNNIRNAFTKSVFVVQEIFKRLVPVFLQVGGIIAGAVGRIIGALAPIVAYIVNTVGPIIGKVFGFIGTEVIPRLIQGFQKILPSIQGVLNAIGPLMSGIWGAIKPTIDSIVAAFNFAWPFIKTIVITAIDIISGVIGGLMTTLEGVITFVTGVFTGNWAQAWEGIKGIFSGVWEGIKSIAVGAINGVIRIINDGISKINGLSFDLPEVFGGGHVGVNVPKIPEIGGGGGGSKISTGTYSNQSSGRMQAFARGGYADRASIFGEAGGEWAIPDRKTPRSMQLLDQANKSLGYKGGGGTMNITYAPVNNFAGPVDKEMIQETQRDSYKEFERNQARFMKQKGRLAFGG